MIPYVPKSNMHFLHITPERQSPSAVFLILDLPVCCGKIHLGKRFLFFSTGMAAIISAANIFQ
jgi:hypothetical protein